MSNAGIPTLGCFVNVRTQYYNHQVSSWWHCTACDIPTFLQVLQCFQAPPSILSPEAGQVRVFFLLEPLISTTITSPAHLTHTFKHQHPEHKEKNVWNIFVFE